MRLRRRRRFRTKGRPPVAAARQERHKKGLGGVLFGLEGADDAKDLFLPGRLSQQLPDGVYRFANEPHDARLAALAFALGLTASRATARPKRATIKLDLPQSLDRDELERIVEGVTLARDLINTPANDMGPAELEAAARKLAAQHGATIPRHRRRRSAGARIIR